MRRKLGLIGLAALVGSLSWGSVDVGYDARGKHGLPFGDINVTKEVEKSPVYTAVYHPSVDKDKDGVISEKEEKNNGTDYNTHDFITFDMRVPENIGVGKGARIEVIGPDKKKYVLTKTKFDYGLKGFEESYIAGASVMPATLGKWIDRNGEGEFDVRFYVGDKVYGRKTITVKE